MRGKVFVQITGIVHVIQPLMMIGQILQAIMRIQIMQIDVRIKLMLKLTLNCQSDAGHAHCGRGRR